MNATIRAATKDDAHTLASLHRRCFDEAWDAAAFTRLLQNPGTFALLRGAAETYSQAFVLVQVAAGEAEILSLGTEPEARRQNFARELLATAAAEASSRGAKQIFLEVAHDNTAALGLYTRMGFSVCGRRAAYYHRGAATPADALVLRAALPLPV